MLCKNCKCIKLKPLYVQYPNWILVCSICGFKYIEPTESPFVY